MNIGVIVQTRTSSTRLPKKVLKKLPYNSNITVIEQVIRRLKHSKMINKIIIATTIDIEDDIIVDIAKKENVSFFRGSVNNVLERYYLSAKENNLDIIIRITSDCPCIDPEIIDKSIDTHIKNNSDYTATILKRTYFHGSDTEVFNFSTLEKVYKNATTNFEKEHVTLYIHQSHPELFKLTSIEAPEYENYPELRLTIDTEEDYVLLCCVFDYLYNKNNVFKSKDIIDLFKNKPWLTSINNKIIQKKVFDTIKEEVNEAIKILDLQDLKKAKNILEKFNS